MKKHNFSAGPAILPDTVIKQAAQAVQDIDGIGLSILEISHRSPKFEAILNEARSLVKELMGLDDRYEVLYLTGGASSQFFMAAMNLLNPSDKALYVNTGAWSTKAIKEATHFSQVDVIASSKDGNFNYIPKDYDVADDATYLHLTSNNTIFGTQYHHFPNTKVPIVCDMSSDIFSRPVDVDRFGLIYAGAQKNMGPAGTTLVVVRKDMLNKVQHHIPSMLDYNTHIKKGSSFNTPPTFPIYVSMLTLRWVKERGGLKAMEDFNKEKAALMYGEIDRNEMFKGTAKTEDRSLMNATFVLAQDDDTAAARFMEMTKEAGISGIKGHRSVGGFRASIYNAMPMDSVRVLVDVMSEFERTA